MIHEGVRVVVTEVVGFIQGYLLKLRALEVIKPLTVNSNQAI